MNNYICIKEFNSTTSSLIRILGAGDLIRNLIQLNCNIVLSNGAPMQEILYLSPEIHSVQYMQYINYCDLFVHTHPIIEQRHESYSFFSSDFVPSGKSPMTWVGFFRNDNLIKGTSFGPSASGNRFAYAGHGFAYVFNDTGGGTVNVTSKFITQVTRVTSDSYGS